MGEACNRSPGDAAAEPTGNGLHANRDGLDGWIFETTPILFMQAVARHEALLQEFETTRARMTPGMSLLVGLAFDDAVATLEDVNAATGRNAQCYRDGATVYLEWQRVGGLRGRCELSPATQAAITRHGSTAVSVKDWQAAARWAHAHRPGLPPKQVWSAFFADAQAWWHPHFTGPAFAHVTGLRSLQLLPRAVLARALACRAPVGAPGASAGVQARCDAGHALARLPLDRHRSRAH